MAIRPLNSVNGFSVGDSSNVVVYANLDIVGNTITADSNLIGNGLLVNGVSNLSSISNVKIFGGNSGEVLSTDGAGNLTFTPLADQNSAAPMPTYVPVGDTAVVPANYQGLFSQSIIVDGTFEIDGVLIQITDTINASNNQILYSDNGTPTGNVGFTFNSTTGNLYIPGNIIGGDILPAVSNTYNLGSPTSYFKDLYLSGNSIYLGTGVISTDANGAISLLNANGGQLVVSGNSTVTSIDNGNSNVTIIADGNVITSVGGNAAIFTVSGTGANVFGTFSASGNATAGAIKTDNYLYANGNPISFTGEPVGPNTSIQFNNNNDFDGTSNLTFNPTVNLLSLTGNLSVSGNINSGNINSYDVVTSNAIVISSSPITVVGNSAGIFNTQVTDINIGVQSNITLGSSTGTVTVQNDLNVGDTLDAPNITVGDLYSRRSSVPVTTDTIIDTFPASYFRTAKYTIRAGDGVDYQALEVLLVHNNINSIITVYGSLSTSGTDLIAISSNINGSNVEVKATAVGGSATVNLLGTYVPD